MIELEKETKKETRKAKRRARREAHHRDLERPLRYILRHPSGVTVFAASDGKTGPAFAMGTHETIGQAIRRLGWVWP